MSEVPFSDFGLKWFEDIIERITEWFTEELVGGLQDIGTSLFATPLPEGDGTARVLTKPPESDELWHGIYETTVAGEMMVFGLVILFLCVQGRHFIRIFNIGSAYEQRKAQRSSWTGALLIVTWYWVAVLTLYVTHALTIGLLPNIVQVAEALVSILPHAVDTPIVTLIMAMAGGMSMLALQALFFIREVLLYVFLYGMPVGLAVAYGNVPVLSRIAQRICAQFIPLAILPLPAALLFRGYAFLFTGEAKLTVSGSFFEYLVVISLPIIALFVTWKTFRYASPLAARALGTASRGTVLLGTVAGAAALGGPRAAAAAGRWGPAAGAGAALSSRYRTARQSGDESASDSGDPDAGGRPEYRRKENDPAYY
jgi:type IV secretion system protein TrbL